MKDKEYLVTLLAQALASGKVDPQYVVPALKQSTGDSSPSIPIPELLQVLQDEQRPVFARLADHLREVRRREALEFNQRQQMGAVHPEEYQAILGDLPLKAEAPGPWRASPPVKAPLESVFRLLKDKLFLADKKDAVPQVFQVISERCSEAMAQAHRTITDWGSLVTAALVDGVPGSAETPAAVGGSMVADLKARIMAWQREMTSRAREILDRTPASVPEALDQTQVQRELADRFSRADTRDEKRKILDLACCWPTRRSIPLILDLNQAGWAQERSLLLLTLRFGQPSLRSWEAWRGWLLKQQGMNTEDHEVEALIRQQPAAVLLTWYSQQPNPDAQVIHWLETQAATQLGPVDRAGFMASWSEWLEPAEKKSLLAGLGTAPAVEVQTPPNVAEQPVAAAVAAPLARPFRAPVPEVRPEPLPPRQPSLWEEHIQPFFVENWYIVAGIAMVIAGSSLLAYYTWDKHWLLRYTIMPALLGIFTWSLAGTGGWIEKKSSQFKDTAAILRGAAIGLLPVNFMAIALLSADAQVSHRGLAVLAMSLIYLGVFGWSLRRWCAEVEPALGTLLGGTLLALNGLVALGPVIRNVAFFQGPRLWLSLGAGFYLGFLVLGAAVYLFTRRVITPEMAGEKRVPWFFGATLTVTFLQVFAWVHGFMHHLPRPTAYALLVIATGGLILFVERRALELRAQLLSTPVTTTPTSLEPPDLKKLHGGESFLGFAFILLGLFMGATEPYVRIATFLLAGTIWLYQASARQHPLHYWIGLTMLVLGGAAIGLLKDFPGEGYPGLGLGLALALGVGHRLSQKLGQPELPQSCLGMQVVVLVLTAFVAPLSQWHYHSPPLMTAAWLLAVAILFAWRALKDQRLRWLHTTMVVLALALPYLGFVDLEGQNPRGNNLVFGLSILAFFWLGITWTWRTPLILQARSTVLWLYGAMALAAMVLRVILRDVSPDPAWHLHFMDYTGPWLMTVVLVLATYYSRSLIPAGMAIGIIAILFPELKASLQMTFTWLGWGTGLGSAISSLVLALICFRLRDWKFLSNLGEGDLFLGKEPFPWRRYDHTLFTWPVMAAAIYFTVKVDTWNLLRNLLGSGVGVKTAVALGLTGISWTLIGVYHRRHRWAVPAVHLGWTCLLAGVFFGYWQMVKDPHWAWPVLITALVLQGLFFLYRYALEPAYPWVNSLLTLPTRQVLTGGSAVLSLICTLGLVYGAGLDRLEGLIFFLMAQLIWHALATRQPVFGFLLFFLTWATLLAWTAPGQSPLWERITVAQSVNPTLWLLLSVHLMMVILEFNQAIYEKLKPLLSPPFLIVSLLAVLLGLAGTVDGVWGLACTRNQQWLLLLVILLSARAHGSGLVLLLGLVFSYILVHRPELALLGTPEDQWELLGAPWRVAWFALTMVVLCLLGRLAYHRQPIWFTGRYAHPWMTAPSCAWIYHPAGVLVGLAVGHHTFSTGLRESAIQLWAPYLGTMALALTGWFWNRRPYFIFAGLALVLGNIHGVRVGWGEMLRQQGLSELHLICLGVSATLLQASLGRWKLRNAGVIAVLNQGCLVCAGFVLALLSANYIADPDLVTITRWRFIVSGAMAWLAGQYFRRAARRPGVGEALYVELCEGLYHFGMVLALWCAALLVPFFRQPAFTLLALSLPVLYFYLRAELGFRAGFIEARRYRNSAAVLGFVVLGLYVFRGIFHMVLFPEMTVATDYYHYNSPLAMVLALVLLRLHGLGGTSWLALYGGLSLMVGSYFALTALPGMSPFTYPMPSAWCALGLAHFWVVASYARSPLRTAIQRLAGLDESAWHSLRRSWGWCLLVASQGLALWGILDFAAHTRMVAPLMAGAASIFIHQGIIKKSRVYGVLAALELALALHADFLMPSYLPKDGVIWVILGIWLAHLAVHQFKPDWISREILGGVALVCGGLTLPHIFYHHPGSYSGLWGMALAAVFAAWQPVNGTWISFREQTAVDTAVGEYSPSPSSRRPLGLEQGIASLLPWVPTWLVYFSQAPLRVNPLDIPRWPGPVLAALVTFFLTGCFARVYQVQWASVFRRWPRSQPRLFDLTLGWFETAGGWIQVAVLWLSFILALLIQVTHYHQAFALPEFILLTGLEAGLAVAWFYQGKSQESAVPYYLLQLSVVACFAAIRRHLMLTTGFWNYEYDVWASLAASFLLAGALQVFDLRPRKLRVPVVSMILVLPAVALIWVLVHHLGANVALLVVGLQSMMFAYLGKDERESPFNVVAIAGFVSFVILVFWTKLQLTSLNAYLIPTGLGLLVLLQLFRERITPPARNGVRLVVLLSMLGSSAYYVLADTRYSVTFNLTLILLSLLAMGVGSFLRVRLYLGLGFLGLVVDLASLLYKVLFHLERSSRMTAIGSLVLLIGAGVIFGAIYYKTNKEKLDALLNHWRAKLGEWE